MEHRTSNNVLNRNPWAQNSFTAMDKNTEDIDYQQKKLAAHAFLYCESSAFLFGDIKMEYGIMMQLRFDGTFGFPGGILETKEAPVDGLNRELNEEIGLAEKYFFSEENYFRSWIGSKFVDHFYIKKYSESDFIEIEKNLLHSKDWGGETLGTVRVPVHELHNHSKLPPFVGFLCHKFIANAQEQLIESILRENIFSAEKMVMLWETYSNANTR